MAGVLIAGTTSDAGKSFVATGLCRLLARRGWNVRPYKAANMSLNAVPADDGGEMASAQAVQCQAAGVPAVTASNPILYKSEGPGRVEVIVRGHVRWRVRSWTREMPRLAPQLAREAHRALREVRSTGAFVVAEGAGSPVELNLQRTDLSNLRVARWLGAPILLVADLERGGAMAQVVGTLALLRPLDRRRVQGLILNRMSGDPSLLDSAVRFLERETGCPVLGILPLLSPSVAKLPPEDSLDLPRQQRAPKGRRAALPRVAIIRLPHTSNFSDFTPLARQSALRLEWVERPDQAEGAAALMLPGTRRTVDDLGWMRRQGWEPWLRARSKTGLRVIGICGGYQMLGERLDDPEGFEGPAGRTQGLGLLPVSTRFSDPKLVRHVEAVPAAHHPWGLPHARFPGFEMRRGVTKLRGGARPAFRVRGVKGAPTGWQTDGCVGARDRVWGTALHGLFNDPRVVAAFLRGLGSSSHPSTRRGASSGDTTEAAIDAVADLLEEHLDLRRLGNILGRPLRPSAPPPRQGRGGRTG